MDVFRRMAAQMRAYWAGLSAGRRIGVVAGAVLVLVALGAVVYLSPGARYVPVAAGPLPADEVGAMRTRLTAENIPSRLTTGGTNIEVPEERHAEAVVALAGGGFPARGGKGYELFDETSLMTTPFVQSVNYQRALQSELARSIMQIESVQSARVLIAKPDPSPFVREGKQPTASVVIKLKPRAAMSPATASGVVSLVARSVEGLRPENVTVLDSGGRLLSDPHAGDRGTMPTPQLEYLEKLETYLSTKAEEMLAKTLGPGRAAVRVSADVNLQKIRERVKTYSPEGKVAWAERNASATNAGGTTRGVVGAASNVPRAGSTLGGASGSGSSSSKEEVIQTDYLVSESIRDIEDGGGAVTHLSIAALVDLTPQNEGETVISQADAEAIIKQAIGFRSGRDNVTVTPAKLTGTGAAEPDESVTKLRTFATYVSLARNLSLAFAVVTAVVIAGLLVLRGRAVPVPAEPIAEEVAAGPTPDERRAAELARFVDLARNDPDRVADVFGLLSGTT